MTHQMPQPLAPRQKVPQSKDQNRQLPSEAQELEEILSDQLNEARFLKLGNRRSFFPIELSKKLAI